MNSKKYQKPFFSANYSMNLIGSPSRAVETKTFDRLKDAEKVIEGKFGYILRLEVGKAKVVKYVNGFKPSAQETQKINKILAAWNK